MAKGTRYIGLDAHKATIAVAVADDDRPDWYGTIVNEPAAVRKIVSTLRRPGVELVAAYEAGPTGFALQRLLESLGVRCSVVAPSLVPRRSGDRVKTDRRDRPRCGLDSVPGCRVSAACRSHRSPVSRGEHTDAAGLRAPRPAAVAVAALLGIASTHVRCGQSCLLRQAGSGFGLQPRSGRPFRLLYALAEPAPPGHHGSTE